MVHCPHCGMLTDPKLDGCPHCGGSLQAKAAPSRSAGPKRRQTCPSCKALVQDGDIICVVCGTNLLTGQKIGEEMETASEQKSRTPAVLAGIAVVLAVCIVGSLWFYAVNRDPVNRALRLIEDGDYFSAETILADYVDTVQDDEQAWFELGRVRWHGNKFAQAAQAFEAAVNLNSTNTEAAEWAVVSLAATGTPNVRIRQIEMLDRIVENEPDNEGAKYLLGLATGTSQDVPGQIAIMEKLSSTGMLAQLVDLSLGVALALDGKHGEAQRKLSARGRSPEASKAPFLAAGGFASGLGGDRAAALAGFDAALATQGTLSVRWEVLTQYGKLLMEDGRYQEAEPPLREAMRLRSGGTVAVYLHALCISAMGSAPAALAEFEAILNRQGRYAVEAGAQAASIYLAMGNSDRASDTITRALSFGKADASVHTVHGRVLASQGNNRGALAAFNSAKSLDPEYAAAYLESGLTYLRQEMLGQALHELTTYLDKVGDDVRGTRAYEIRGLVSQLYQTTGGSRAR